MIALWSIAWRFASLCLFLGLFWAFWVMTPA